MKLVPSLLAVVAVLVVGTLSGCSSETPPAKASEPAPAPKPAPPPAPAPPAPPAAAPDPTVEANTVFLQRCSVCHGMDGKGNGPGAAALNPKPRDYTDATWHKSVTDDAIAKVIVEGGASIGKSPLMVANADLKDKPDVVKALVAKIRSFAPAAK